MEEWRNGGLRVEGRRVGGLGGLEAGLEDGSQPPVWSIQGFSSTDAILANGSVATFPRMEQAVVARP